MPDISLTNNLGRDANVLAESVRIPVKVRWVDDQNRQAASSRLLKGTIDRDLDALLEKAGSLEKVGEALIDSDPEIDLEAAGSFLRDTSRVYFNTDRKTVFSITQLEIVRNPDGSEKARRPKKPPTPNVGAEQPLLWSGKFLPKSGVYNKFVMAGKMQLFHINGLTYDFLFGIAKELEAKNSLMLMGAGPKANQPIVLRRGSVPYRGFLEGRTKGDEYCLLLHLSNMELKAPDDKELPTTTAVAEVK
ncbi:MAG TPA: hypothetical protein VGI99_07850 [Gemmataceae bacterium]